MANTYYQLSLSGVSLTTWSFVTGAGDYSKKIVEDDTAYTIQANPDSENSVKNLSGIQVINSTQFNAYFSRIGSHPPQKP